MGRSIQSTILATAVGAALAILPGAAAFAATDGAPSGNNGSIKVNQVNQTANSNDAHVDCVFELDFFGADTGPQTADVTFELLSPTGSGVVLHKTVGFVGHGPGASSDGFDGATTFSLIGKLDAFVPSDQGWHLKVTTRTTGAQGADTKSKVLWVTGCETPPNDDGGGNN